MKGWYEIRGKNLFIWEGVLASYPQDLASCQLFKIQQDEIFEIHVELNGTSIENVESDGYWECVEIRGEVSNGANFLCHSMNPQHAQKILKVLPSAIIGISIRMDPNPFRNWEADKIKERIAEWQKLMRTMCDFPENAKIILDSNMLS